MSQPKPITEYTEDQIKAMVRRAITVQGLTYGFYYDPDDHTHSLKLSPSIHYPDHYVIEYKKGAFLIVFLASVLELFSGRARA